MGDTAVCYLPGPIGAGRLVALIAALEEEPVEVYIDVDLDTGTIVLTSREDAATVADPVDREAMASAAPAEAVAAMSSEELRRRAGTTAPEFVAVFECPACGDEFLTPQGLGRHRQAKHPPTPTDHDAARQRAAAAI